MKENTLLKNENTSNFSAKIFRNFDIPPEVKNMWDELQRYPYADFEYFRNVESAQPNFLCPIIVAVYREGQISGLLIAKIIKLNFVQKLGYKTIFNKSIHLLEIVYGGILGVTDQKHSEFIVGEIQRLQKSREVQAVFFKYPRKDAPILKTIAANVNFVFREHFSQDNIHRGLQLPGNFDEFYSSRSKNTRNNIKKYNNRISKSFKNSIRIETFHELQQLENSIEAILNVSKKTYQYHIGVVARSAEEIREQWQYPAQTGSFRGYLLYLNGSPAAYWTGLAHGEEFLSVATGYDPEFTYYHPGQYLLLRIIKDCCEAGISRLDFGFGEADYKRRFGSEEWLETSLYIFSPNFSGFINGLKQSLFNLVNLFLRYLLLKMGIFGKLRKRGRKSAGS